MWSDEGDGAMASQRIDILPIEEYSSDHTERVGIISPYPEPPFLRKG